MTVAMHVQPCSASGTDSIQAELVEQYLQRLQAGEAVDPSGFAAQYPEHAEALRQLLPALQMMAELSRSAVRDRSSPPLSEGSPAPSWASWAISGSSAKSDAVAWGSSMRPSSSRSAVGSP